MAIPKPKEMAISRVWVKHSRLITALLYREFLL